jgi:excisionase family DNA binding protein
LEKDNLVNPLTLWKYSDLARFLQLSVDKLRRDVMERKIPFIKVGRMVRFDKNQTADFFKIKINEPEKPLIKDNETARMNTINKKCPHNPMNEISSWLSEKSSQHQYAEIGIKLIIHDWKIRRIEKTVVEKIQQ